MKISKLFHWLYAFLMFLPIVLFIPNAFYYGFNEHATNSETTTINYKYQSNEVNSLDDLVEGNIYYLHGNWDDIVGFSEQPQGLELTFYTGSVEFDIDNGVSYANEITTTKLKFYYANDTSIVQFAETGLGAFCSFFYFEDGVFSFNDLELFKDWYLDNQQINLPQYTDYNVIESVEINTDDTISNKMYQAWQSTWNLPFLQWTHNSFVAQPFTYITGLFGVPSDSSLNYIFAYFVSISICWLVFDLIMYVPNLAHRWLDRSALE